MDDDTANEILDGSDNEQIRAAVRDLREKLDRAERQLAELMFEEVEEDVEIEAPKKLEAEEAEVEETPVAPDSVEPEMDENAEDEKKKQR